MSAVAGAAGGIGEEAVKGAVEVVKPIALKATLTATLIFAGLGLAVYGFFVMISPPGEAGRRIKGAALGAALAVPK